MIDRGSITMYNDTQSDLEEDIKRQKGFLIISLRFEILVRRLIAIYIKISSRLIQIGRIVY